MTPPVLGVTGDLQFEVDGTAGTVHAADGRVRVDLDDPLAAAQAVAGTYGGRHGLSQVVAGLAAGGVTAEVHGPRGLLGTAGAGVDSRLGGLLAGSRQVSGRPAAVVSLAPLVGRSGVVGRTGIGGRRGLVVLAAAISGWVVVVRRQRVTTTRRP